LLLLAISIGTAIFEDGEKGGKLTLRGKVPERRKKGLVDALVRFGESFEQIRNA